MAINRFFKGLRDQKDHQGEFESHHADEPLHIGTDDESNWLVSYADMMTLLCGFFIMLFSMSKMDEPQYEKVKESVARQFGGDYQSPSKDLARFITQVIDEAGLDRKDIAVRADPTGIAVTFTSTLFFDPMSAEVRPEGRILMNRLIEAIAVRQNYELKKYRVVVEGHTDGQPLTSGPYPTNWELSSARAARVIRMFLDKGFAADRMTAIGYADTYPEQPSRSPAGEWIPQNLAKNRRVVLRVLEPRMDAIPYPQSMLGAPYGPEPLTQEPSK